MKYIPLTNEQKEELSKETGSPFSGFIMFLLKGEELATTDLLERSLNRQRFHTAEMLGIKEFDDYHLLTEKGDIRVKASDMKGLLLTDIDSDYGTAEGIKYKTFLKRNEAGRCSHCGELISNL
jgi:hypothetical protein